MDASGSQLRSGIVCEGQWLSYAVSHEQVLEGIFGLVSEVLERAHLQLRDVQGFIYCEGPGSILGIRLCAMALRTWRALPEHRDKPTFAYKSLALADAIVRENEAPEGDYAILTESRMNRWNCWQRQTLPGGEGSTPEIRELGQDALDTLPAQCYHLSQRSTVPLQADWKPVDYKLENYPHYFNPSSPLLRQVDAPDAWQVTAGDYQKWSAQRHR